MTSHTNYAASPGTSIYWTPVSSKSNKYSIIDAENSYFYIPPCRYTLDYDQPLTINAPTGTMLSRTKQIDLEWVPHSTGAALTYLLAAIMAMCYYTGCFLRQYGDYSHRIHNDWLDESALTRFVMILWLVIMIFLFIGIFLWRRIFMPVYIFISIIATFGILVLFVVKCKQLHDGRIAYHDIPLNLIGVLLFFSIVHNIAYFYALHLHLIKIKLFHNNYFSSTPIVRV